MVWKDPSERMTREQGTRRAVRESHRDLEEDHSRWREQHVQRSSGWKDKGCMWKQTVGGQQWWEGGQQEPRREMVGAWAWMMVVEEVRWCELWNFFYYKRVPPG